MISKIKPCLWFDNRAEEAANFYISVFPNSKILNISYYSGEGKEQHGHNEGDVLVVNFELDGSPVMILNGGPHFKFTEAVSLVVEVDTQEELDHYWNALSSVPEAEQCGWCKDRYGLSWQIVPKAMMEFILSEDRAATDRAMAAMMQMHKLDIATLKKAFAG